MYEFIMDGKKVSVFPGAESGVPVIYRNVYSAEGRQVFQVVWIAGYPSFNLMANSDLNWNHDIMTMRRNVPLPVLHSF